MKIKLLFSIFFLGLFFLTAPNSWARQTSSRLAEGVIEKVDQETHTLTIKSLEDSKIQVFVWNDRTKFLKNNKLTDPAALKVGTIVDYWYRAPLFGEQFVTKVTWETDQKKEANEK